MSLVGRHEPMMMSTQEWQLRLARSAYLRGKIDLGEYEKRVDTALEQDDTPKPLRRPRGAALR